MSQPIIALGPQIAYSGSLSPQAIDGSGNYNLVCVIRPQVSSNNHLGLFIVTGIVGGTGPLTGLQLTGRAFPGGTDVPLYKDADFNSPDGGQLLSCTQNAYQTASGGTFQMRFNVIGGGEVALWAKSTNTATVAIEAGGGGGGST